MMRSSTERKPGLLPLLAPLLLSGCAHSPSFNVLGSYFPGWIACIVFSVILTSIIRFLLNRLRWERSLPALPLFYFSLACSSPAPSGSLRSNNFPTQEDAPHA